MKKLINTVLAAMLVLATTVGLCSCGGKVDTSKQVTLKWIINFEEQSDMKKVMEKFNSVLSEKLPNTKLELVCAGYDMASKWSMYMSAGESYDICWTGYDFDIESEIKKGSYQPLGDLVNKYAPNILAESKEWSSVYNTAKYKGQLYAIPNMQPILHESTFLNIPAELYTYLDVDALLAETKASPTTTEKVYKILEDYFVKVKAAGKMDTDTIAATISYDTLFYQIACRGYDWIGTFKGGSYICYKAFDENPKVVSFFETDEYKTFVKYMSRWMEMGFIPKDANLSAANAGTRQALVSANGSEMWYGLDEEKGIRYVYGGDGTTVNTYRVLMDHPDNVYNGVTVLGGIKSYTAIPYTSKNPERAIALLDLLRSEENSDLINMFIYGFEKNSEEAKKNGNYHYTLEGDCAYGNGYTAQATSSNAYGLPHWLMGNAYLPYRTPNILEGQKEYAKDYVLNVKPKKHKTKLYGFEVETDPISTKLEQVKTVVAEFSDTLNCGSCGSGWESTYDQMIKKMSAAGLGDIKTELQKQVDSYKSK